MICTYHLCLLTDYWPNPLMQYYVGWSYIVFISILLIYNSRDSLYWPFIAGRRYFYTTIKPKCCWWYPKFVKKSQVNPRKYIS